MRSITLERDDSIFPVSALVSMCFHALLFFVVVTPGRPVEPITEHIYSAVSYQVFPGTQKFQTFSDRHRIYSDASTGISNPTSGTVEVDARLVRGSQARELAPTGTRSPSQLEPVPNRVFYGNQNATSNAPAASGAQNPSRAAFTGGISAPTAPDGTVELWDERNDRSLGFDQRAVPGGTPGVMRPGTERPAALGSSGVPGSPGVVHIPGRGQSLNPTAPTRGTSLDDRAFVAPISTGDRVTDGRPDARPAGNPGTSGPTFGARAILYKPLPSYPAWAERDHIQASPKFHVTVGSDGRVSRVRLARSSGHGELDRLAEESVRRWIYEPRPGQTEVREANVQFVLKR